MKTLLILIICAVAAGLFMDDKSKRADITQLEDRANTAEQQAVAEGQKVQSLTAMVNQLQYQLAHLSNQPAPAAGGARGQPSWFTNQLNGSKGVLDPNGPQP